MRGRLIVPRRGVSIASPPPEPPDFLLGSSFGTDTVGGDWKDWDDEIRAGGSGSGLAAHRSYTGAGFLPTSYTATPINTTWNWDQNIVAVWSTKGTPTSISAGNHDNEIITFLESIPAGRRLHWTMHHEPWDEVSGGDFTQAQFRAACARIIRVMNGDFGTININRSNIQFGIILTAFDFDDHTPADFFPTIASEGVEVDWVGVDGYDFYRDSAANSNSPPNPTAPDDPVGRDEYRTPTEIYGNAFSFAAGYNNKPVLVGEFAFHPDPEYPNSTNDYGIPSRPARLQSAIDYFIANNTIVACMFESHSGSSGPWWMSAFPNWTNENDRTDVDSATVSKIQDLVALYGLGAQSVILDGNSLPILDENSLSITDGG